MQTFHRLLGKIAKAFNRHKIPYMVIGGQAVLQYGRPRLTEDIDVTMGLDSESLALVRKAVDEIPLQPRANEVEKMVKLTNVLHLVEEESGIKVDCIFSFISYEREAIVRAKEIKVGGNVVRFAAIEDVIIHKLVANRPRDIEDVKGILNQNTTFDREYVLYWLKSFSETIGKDLKEDFKEIENSLKRKT